MEVRGKGIEESMKYKLMLRMIIGDFMFLLGVTSERGYFNFRGVKIWHFSGC